VGDFEKNIYLANILGPKEFMHDDYGGKKKSPTCFSELKRSMLN